MITRHYAFIADYDPLCHAFVTAITIIILPYYEIYDTLRFRHISFHYYDAAAMPCCFFAIDIAMPLRCQRITPILLRHYASLRY